ncbi:unnamed protein product [Mytilus coruscus]|uniref:Uncharacterized protein n=1 Tax=Mytilus coruscus TaxID=42192 RepID=A0A6J8EZ88_MYTCO|nr:unnamed protein product [Mytilus coruscus]
MLRREEILIVIQRIYQRTHSFTDGSLTCTESFKTKKIHYFLRIRNMAEMSKAEPNVYVNNIFNEGKTDDDVVYEKCFDPEDQSNYDQLSSVSKQCSPHTDFNLAHNIPNNQSIKEENCLSQKIQVPWRLLLFISCFLITIVVSNVVTFITTKDKFSEKKAQHRICGSFPCVNGGLCVNDDEQYFCSCTRGFSGKNCEVTPCTALDCLNGGSCEVLNGTFHCLCTYGFSGRLCEEAGPCLSNPCFNSGSCTVSGKHYTCNCLIGTDGSRCQDVLFETITSPGYPSNYTDDINEKWNIDVGLGNTVRIKFTLFELEKNYDYVKIYDGHSTKCGSIGNFTGNTLPTEWISTGRYVSIVFTSDESRTGRGFRVVIYRMTST